MGGVYYSILRLYLYIPCSCLMSGGRAAAVPGQVPVGGEASHMVPVMIRLMCQTSTHHPCMHIHLHTHTHTHTHLHTSHTHIHTSHTHLHTHTYTHHIHTSHTYLHTHTHTPTHITYTHHTHTYTHHTHTYTHHTHTYPHHTHTYTHHTHIHHTCALYSASPHSVISTTFLPMSHRLTH